MSFDQFKKDWLSTFGSSDIENIEEIYDNVHLPERKTSGSAGYDFCSPIPFYLKPNQTIKIPTGIRCNLNDGWVLKIYPRSSLGFKYRLQLDNTVGIIDSDYYFSDNEGHIFVKITNDSNSNKILYINTRDCIFQGIFVEYGLTYDDNVKAIRNGGFGSTNK